MRRNLPRHATPRVSEPDGDIFQQGAQVPKAPVQAGYSIE
jgi:hypothetical protein